VTHIYKTTGNADDHNRKKEHLTNCYVRFEVFVAVIMKNVVFWDIKTQFVPHRRHITSPLQGSGG
jgi:hypothetical protein